jgi:hypothetical protein
MTNENHRTMKKLKGDPLEGSSSTATDADLRLDKEEEDGGESSSNGGDLDETLMVLVMTWRRRTDKLSYSSIIVLFSTLFCI